MHSNFKTLIIINALITPSKLTQSLFSISDAKSKILNDPTSFVLFFYLHLSSITLFVPSHSMAIPCEQTKPFFACITQSSIIIINREKQFYRINQLIKQRNRFKSPLTESVFLPRNSGTGTELGGGDATEVGPAYSPSVKS